MTNQKKFFAEHNHYDLLNIDSGATSIEVQEAFEYHSQDIDLNHPSEFRRVRSAEKLLLITQAYEVLSDPIQRSHYDIRIFGRRSLPSSLKIDAMFNEGIKAYRLKKTDHALRYFKEIVNLFPHRSLYRVHLAIIYAEKNWLSFCEAELQTALRLDSEDKFAQDTIARLLFKLPDRKVVEFGNRAYKQAATMAASVILCSFLWVSGVPQKATASAVATVSSGTQQLFGSKSKSPVVAPNDELPADVQMEIQEAMEAKKAKSQKVQLQQFPATYVPEGNHFNYTEKVANQKTFYPGQNIVVITYEDNSVLTYKPMELAGWKVDSKTQQAVMITAEGELIPSPSSIPVTLPSGDEANLDQLGVSSLFPEYGDTTYTEPVEEYEEQAEVSDFDSDDYSDEVETDEIETDEIETDEVEADETDEIETDHSVPVKQKTIAPPTTGGFGSL